MLIESGFFWKNQFLTYPRKMKKLNYDSFGVLSFDVLINGHYLRNVKYHIHWKVYYVPKWFLCDWYHGLLNTWPCMPHLKAKIRTKFSKNIVLWIHKFLFHSGDRISKEKKIWKFWQLKIQNMTIQLNNCLLN